jgi:hypothetical protein
MAKTIDMPKLQPSEHKGFRPVRSEETMFPERPAKYWTGNLSTLEAGGDAGAGKPIDAFRRVHIISKNDYLLWILKRTLVPVRAEPSIHGSIYIARHTANYNAVKIGYTHHSVTARIRQWQMRCRSPLIPIFEP